MSALKDPFRGDPIIALDFDAVLHEYRGSNDGKMLGPIDGALEAVQELQNRGFRVVVFSTRDEAMIRPWLAEHSFPELEICSEKPPAVCFVDLSTRYLGFSPIGSMVTRQRGKMPKKWKLRERILELSDRLLRCNRECWDLKRERDFLKREVERLTEEKRTRPV
jgi:hypothetical protein